MSADTVYVPFYGAQRQVAFLFYAHGFQSQQINRRFRQFPPAADKCNW